MEVKRTVSAVVLALFLLPVCAHLSVSRSDRQAGAAGPPDKDKPPIVRTDILFLDRDEVGPPLRDIFRPRVSKAPAARPAAKPPAAKPPPPAEPAFVLDLTYIGSVGVAGRIMALVLRSGQTISLAEGDEIVKGYRVVRITADEIVVEGPNAERKTFTR